MDMMRPNRTAAPPSSPARDGTRLGRGRPPAPDAVLLCAWRKGSAAAGERLVRRHLDAVRSYVAHRVPGAADDLVQATFLAAVSTDGYRGAGSYRNYLLGIARHQVCRHFRSCRRDRLVLDASPLGVEDPATVTIDLAPQQRRLREVVARLSDDLRTALTLHYWHHLTTGQLAVALRIPRGTAKSRLRRGREALREQLGLGSAR